MLQPISIAIVEVLSLGWQIIALISPWIFWYS
jgi:hypothetical protein